MISHYSIVLPNFLLAPPGGVWGTLKYIGVDTKCCIPCALLCPRDERVAYAVNGRVYGVAGNYICYRRDDNFIPTHGKHDSRASELLYTYEHESEW